MFDMTRAITCAGAPARRTDRGMALILTYLTSLIVFLSFDAFWLGVAGGAFYRDVLGDLMLNGFRVVPAMTFYLLQIAGIVTFVLPQERVRANLWWAAAYGAFYGICTYGTYDLTNQATLRNWSSVLSVVDVAWGTTLAATTSLITWLIVNRLLGAA